MSELIQFDGNYTLLENVKAAQIVEIEGETVSYLPNPEYPNKNAFLYVKLKNGKVVEISLAYGNLYFEDGSLPIINPPYPLPGDIIKVYVQYTKGNLWAPSTRSAWLLVPCQKRNLDYQKQRNQISQFINHIQNLSNNQEIRENFATLIKNNIILNSYKDRLNITADDIEQINQCIHTQIKNPQERPLLLWERIYEAEEINNVYGVDVYAMSVKTFYDFCFQIANGEKRPINKGSVDYHFRFLQQFYSQQQQQEIYIQTIHHFYPQIIGKHLIFEDRVTNKYNPRELLDPNNITFETEYIFDQALSYLSGLTSPTVAKVYCDLTNNMYQKNRFRTDATDNLVFCEFYIFDGMHRNIVKTLHWQNQQIIGIIDEPAVKIYVQQLPLLWKLSSKLRQIGWTNTGRIDPTEQCQKVINLLLQVEEIMSTQEN